MREMPRVVHRPMCSRFSWSWRFDIIKIIFPHNFHNKTYLWSSRRKKSLFFMRAGESFRLAKIIHILGSQNEQATCYITSWNFFSLLRYIQTWKLKLAKNIWQKPRVAKNKHHRRRQQQIFIFSYEFEKIIISIFFFFLFGKRQFSSMTRRSKCWFRVSKSWAFNVSRVRLMTPRFYESFYVAVGREKLFENILRFFAWSSLARAKNICQI